MSLFGAINTAVSGLTAQSAAFSNISEDVANSQTVGFKRVDTSFVDYLTTSTPVNNTPGAVIAHPVYINNVQGSLIQTDNLLGMAIAGQGFFAVSQPVDTINGVTTFNPQQYYSRVGDFSMNAAGFLVNSAGQYLNAWTVDQTTKAADKNALVPIQVDQQTFNPLKTTKVTLAANLPASPTAGSAITGSPLSSQITVYDALGTAHPVVLNWTRTPDLSSTAAVGDLLPNQWTVQISVPKAIKVVDPALAATSNTDPTDIGMAQVSFGPDLASPSVGDPTADPGTIGTVARGDGNTAGAGLGTISGSSSYPVAPATTAASLTFVTNFGSGDQTITLNLGTYGGTGGVTQYAGTTYSLLGLTQDGIPPGSFSGVTTEANGNVVVNYNNGQTRTIAQVPLVTFNAPNALQRQNGQSFTSTPSSGSPLAIAAGTNGAGNLVVGSVENSNVDIATEFTKLIVAQQAYSSNTKVVTTANQMLQATLQMIG